MRWRTIDQTAAHIREQDEHTALTKTAIRRMVVTGALPSVRAGAKYLLDLDVMEDYLSAGACTEQAPDVGGIRRIEVRP